MGKKKPSKTPKHEKKPQIYNLNKMVRPKVFITESSNFKNLVQQLTGNANGNSPVSSPAPAPPHVSSPPILLIPFNQDQENSLERSFDSLEGPDFSSQFMDLESLLMGIDSPYGVDMMHKEVCLYDYDISSFM